MPVVIKNGKKQWQPTPRRKVMRGTPLNPNAAIEARYYQAMRALIREMSNHTQGAIAQLYAKPVAEAYFAQDDTMSAQAKLVLSQLLAKFEPIFNIAAPTMAERMAKAESQSSAASLNTSLKQLASGLSIPTNIISGDIKEILDATIAENVALIKSIPQQYFTQIQGAVMRSITTGNGEADLVPFLQKQYDVTLNRARIIARDQTRKAFSNLNFARMQKVGITEYEWLHSNAGQKPRKLHQKMSGNVYNMADPPVIQEAKGAQPEIRGKPGDLINCRCRAVPIVNFDRL